MRRRLRTEQEGQRGPDTLDYVPVIKTGPTHPGVQKVMTPPSQPSLSRVGAHPSPCRGTLPQGK